MKVYLICLLLLPYFALSKNNQSIVVGNIYTQVLGHSGKISVTKYASDGTNKTFTITMDRITEVDSNGIATIHSFDNFAQLDFSFSEVQSELFQNLNSQFFTFTTNQMIQPTDSLVANVRVFQQDGLITPGNSGQVQVSSGNVKFSFDVLNWPFCEAQETCSGVTCCVVDEVYQVGSYLDFAITISGPNLSSPSAANAKKLTFGTSNILMTSDIKIDDSWTTMPEGYPKQDGKNKTTFVFRIPKFTSHAEYDPIIQFGSTNGSNYVSYSILILFLLIVSLF